MAANLRPLLLAGALLASSCAGSRSAPATGPPPGTPLGVTLRTFDGGVEIRADDAPFATLHLDVPPGPCILPIHGTHGERVTRGFPLDPGPDDDSDHPHHRSLWFAHGDVDGVDFWHDGGTIETLKHEVDLPRPGLATVRMTLAWIANDGREVLREERRYSFHAEEGLRWIEARHALRAAGDGVVFGDTKEGTFAVRIAPTLRAEGPVARGTLVDEQGHSGREVWGKRSAWIAATGPLVGADGVEREISVALLEHPSNARFPTWWHARTYGLLAANPFGKEAFEGRKLERDGAYELDAGDVLVLRYRVLISGEPLDAEQLREEHRRFSAGEGEEGLI